MQSHQTRCPALGLEPCCSGCAGCPHHLARAILEPEVEWRGPRPYPVECVANRDQGNLLVGHLSTPGQARQCQAQSPQPPQPPHCQRSTFHCSELCITRLKFTSVHYWLTWWIIQVTHVRAKGQESLVFQGSLALLGCCLSDGDWPSEPSTPE